MVKRVVDQLVDKGKVVRGWIGVSLQPLSPELAQSLGLDGTQGAVVGSTIAGSPAAQAGLQQGDVILSYNKIPSRTTATCSASWPRRRRQDRHARGAEEEAEDPGQPDDRRGA